MDTASLSPEIIDRFWSKVEKSPGCWEWRGWRNDAGYGYFQPTSQKKVRAHRLSYLLMRGDLPNGKLLDHKCENKGCVRPGHLEPVTNAENIAAYYRRKKRKR